MATSERRKVFLERLRVFWKEPPRWWDGRFVDFEMDVQSAGGAILTASLKEALRLVDIEALRDSEVSDNPAEEQEGEVEQKRTPPREPSFDRSGPGGIGDRPLSLRKGAVQGPPPKGPPPEPKVPGACTKSNGGWMPDQPGIRPLDFGKPHSRSLSPLSKAQQPEPPVEGGFPWAPTGPSGNEEGQKDTIVGSWAKAITEQRDRAKNFDDKLQEEQRRSLELERQLAELRGGKVEKPGVDPGPPPAAHAEVQSDAPIALLEGVQEILATEMTKFRSEIDAIKFRAGPRQRQMRW